MPYKEYKDSGRAGGKVRHQLHKLGVPIHIIQSVIFSDNTLSYNGKAFAVYTWCADDTPLFTFKGDYERYNRYFKEPELTAPSSKKHWVATGYSNLIKAVGLTVKSDDSIKLQSLQLKESIAQCLERVTHVSNTIMKLYDDYVKLRCTTHTKNLVPDKMLEPLDELIASTEIQEAQARFNKYCFMRYAHTCMKDLDVGFEDVEKFESFKSEVEIIIKLAKGLSNDCCSQLGWSQQD